MVFIHLHFEYRKEGGDIITLFLLLLFLLYWVDRIPSFVLHIRFRLCTRRWTYLARVPKTCQQQRKDVFFFFVFFHSLKKFHSLPFFFFFLLLNLNASSWMVGGIVASRREDARTTVSSLYRSQSRDLNHFPITHTRSGWCCRWNQNFSHDIINQKNKDFV